MRLSHVMFPIVKLARFLPIDHSPVDLVRTEKINLETSYVIISTANKVLPEYSLNNNNPFFTTGLG